ncbi:hypothetical protein DMC30DRAFT_418525 [Rhodotorula diobovata]|uniref:Sugar phosphate transporter domain-containing protein n=1 Tax=Rhodotorula diobovata TaxID=5288 RepID=A0A5C5FPP5_9BASI|nr:hypothetical protein DMC30DRAFT_418525 [Rhodotorula diobovata]
MDVGSLAATPVLANGHARGASTTTATQAQAAPGPASLPKGSLSTSVSRTSSPRISIRKTDSIPYAESFTRVRISPATSPNPSRSSSPLLGTSTSSPGPRRHNDTRSPWLLRPVAVHPPDVPALARRVSLSVRDYAHAAARPATYIHFVRSLHPSLLALFVVSVSATLSNKSLLRGYFHGLTYSLTSWQMLCATGGTVLAQRTGAYRPQRIASKHNRELHVIAFVSSCEILCSALALRLIPVPFHVSLRAASPILTLVLSIAFFHERATLRASSALLAVLLGVALTSHNEDYLSLGSLLLIASALLLTAKSLLLTHYLQSRLNLHPLDCLARMSPLSAMHCLGFALANGEPRRLWRFVQGKEFTNAHVAEVALNGVLSFAAVALALVAEKKTRAPAMAITTHAAQATTILSSVLLFGLRLSPLNLLGVAVTLGGGVLYALWDARDKEREAWEMYASGNGNGSGGVYGLGIGAGGGGGGGGGGWDGRGGGEGEGLPTRAPVVQKPD